MQGLTSFVRAIEPAEPAAKATVTVTMTLPAADHGGAGGDFDAGRGVTLDVTVDMRELLARAVGEAAAMRRLPVPSAAEQEPSAAARALVGRTVADVERALILETLQHCAGNRTHAASVLGISIRTLRNKLHQYNIDGFPVPPAAGFGAG